MNGVWDEGEEYLCAGLVYIFHGERALARYTPRLYLDHPRSAYEVLRERWLWRCVLRSTVVPTTHIMMPVQYVPLAVATQDAQEARDGAVAWVQRCAMQGLFRGATP